MASGELKFRGIDLVRPVNRILAGFCSVCINVRAYLLGGVTFRNLLTGALYTLAAAVHSIRRLNDLTPNGPASGYSIINGAGTVLSAWNSTIGVNNVATGLSGSPDSMIPFRPNASVQPWMYVADSAAQGAVTLNTQYLGANASGPSGTVVNFVSNGMMKVSCNDGYTGTPTPTAVCWKMGIKEPQLAPVVSTQNSSIGTTGTLLATAIPWTNYNTSNSSYNYGETEGYPNTTPPVDGTEWVTINCLYASYITINSMTPVLTPSAPVINGATITTQAQLIAATSGRVGAGSPGYPGQYLQNLGFNTHPSTASYVVGAFVDASGSVMTTAEYVWVAPLFIPAVVDVGQALATSTNIPVPYGASSFQIGINSVGNTFTQGGSPNSGSININYTVTTLALPPVTATIGTLTAYYWGDSPTSGPVASYIWKNPGDSGGSGPTRSTSDAVGSTTGNSFIFDASFGSACVPPLAAGIPGLPGRDISSSTNVDLNPMLWTDLSPESVAVGSNAVFAVPITTTYTNNTQYTNFNICLTGNIYFPSAGHFTFVLTSKDDVIWGIGGGVTLVSASSTFNSGVTTPVISDHGQTITVANGLSLLPRTPFTSGGGGQVGVSTVIVNAPAAGIYPIELDYDYWYHSGRILLLMASPTVGASPTIIPPLTGGSSGSSGPSIRQEVQYRYVYRSSATGAVSNPSPESTAQAIPVMANTITSLWSPDPQVDVVDYYRIDSTVASFTYVNTGPNDNSGSGTNTPVSDSLPDTSLGNQLLDYDNYEPFPSIDLPQKGICNSSGGVITWVSGGAIGGSATGFNIRWLAGTEILIGSPTSLAYTFIARPTSGTQVTIPGVPDGTNLTYEIPEPILAAQPLPYMWGPTDNINFAYAVGDPLRPGTLYWCKGSNLDSAPDTNQQDVTSPDEALVNGAISGGLGVLFSIKRGWLILPNFASATATATGTTGSTWTLQESSITRGLYIPRCVVVSGGGLIFFRVADGVHVSSYGSASQSITDQDLYPLFPHESSDSGTSVPQPITRNGVTIYPPNDALPAGQRFSVINQFMYYDYLDATSTPRTLVYDIEAHGWILDTYTPPVTIHSPSDGQSKQGVLIGCSDFTVRQMASNGTETISGVVATPAFGGRGYMHCGMAVVEYSSTSTVTLTFYVADEGNGSYAPQPVTLPSTGGQLAKYFFRPSAGKWKLLTAQFSSSVPFILNFQGAIFYLKAWGSTSEYSPTPIFGGAGGEG